MSTIDDFPQAEAAEKVKKPPKTNEQRNEQMARIAKGLVRRGQRLDSAARDETLVVSDQVVRGPGRDGSVHFLSSIDKTGDNEANSYSVKVSEIPGEPVSNRVSKRNRADGLELVIDGQGEELDATITTEDHGRLGLFDYQVPDATAKVLGELRGDIAKRERAHKAKVRTSLDGFIKQ